MMYHDNRVYHGGTEKGCKFLEENSDVLRCFSLAVYTESVSYLTNAYIHLYHFYSYISYLTYIHNYFVLLAESHEPTCVDI